MPFQKQCKNCQKEFDITDSEKTLRQKLAPEILGKKFDLPEPNLCPQCRNQKRTAFRNERKLYKRNCSSCEKEVVSVYSPDKTVNTLCRDCFWSDKVGGCKYNLEYSEEKPFFAQFGELLRKAKVITLLTKNNENSDYVNQENDAKNCYMCVGGHWNQDCYYCTFSIKGNDNIDCYFVWSSNNLYESVSCQNCANSKFLNQCHNCSDCYLCENCVGCTDCFGSCNLYRKQYYFFNKQLSKEEYKKAINEMLKDKKSKKEALNKFVTHRLKYPKKFAMNQNCENCAGDNLVNCKKMSNCFWSEDSEDCINGYITGIIKDTLDSYSFGIAELCFNTASSAQLNRSYCSTHCVESNDIFYCSNCFNSNNLFGCVGLIKKEFCILNIQYSQDEYFEKIQQIIANMQKMGEWGNFFPYNISLFGYNETVAQEIYPLEKAQALKLGASWQDDDFGIKFDGLFYEPKDIKEYDPQCNPEAQKEIDECLKGILKCEKSERPFKIIPQELRYYIRHNIEIPRCHPDQRHLDRMVKLNPMKLYHRECMCEESGHDHEGGCKNEFETTYALDRPERVYCEQCYQKTVL